MFQIKSSFVGIFLLLVFSGCTKSNEIRVQSLSQAQLQILRSQAQVGQFLNPGEKIPEAPPTKEERCKKRIAALPKDYIYGWLEVPETPSKESSPKINIFYYGRVKADKKLKQDITVFFNGGPGGDSESSFLRLSSLQAKDAKKNNVSFLFIDQRGNGCSDFYPQGDSEDILRRLANYGTRGIVADAEAIRHYLIGDQKWRVFGQSYGAFVVHKYAILNPNSIASAYAHANTITSSPVSRHSERIASQDRVLKEYLKEYPSDLAKFEKMNAALFEKPCVVDQTEKKYCGYLLATPFGMMLGFKTSWLNLHNWLNSIVKDDGSVNLESLGNLALLYLIDDDLVWNNKLTMHNVVAYVDRNYVDMEGKLCQKVHAELRERGLHPEKFILDECKDENTIYADGSPGEVDTTDYSLLSKLQTDWMTPDQLKISLESHPQLDFNLYSGELDCFVPVANFKEEVDILKPFINYTHFPTSGHDGFYSESKVWQDLVK